MRALGAWEQAGALNELLQEIKRLGDSISDANNRVTDAKIALLKVRGGDTFFELKRTVLDNTRKMQNVKTALQGRKEQIKILQTLLRAIPA
jgi:hypothetical protein